MTKNINDKNTIGGKARNLMLLDQRGYKVPNWMVLPTVNLGDESHFETNEAVLVNQFISQNDEQSSYAVRSSAVEEDGKQHSFAGQFETYLNVTADSVMDAVARVKKSASSERVMRYRKERGLEPIGQMAVIIQEMVNAEVSGVAFSVNPVSLNEKETVISAVYGLGEGLVSGELSADTYYVTDENIRKEIADKQRAYVMDENTAGLQLQDLPESKRELACLSDEAILELNKVLKQLERDFGGPQDVEFAFSKGQLFILQTRPVTNFSTKEKGEYTLWDNSNIVESYPGITTPLTFSFIQKMYEGVYRQLANLLGVSKRRLNTHSDVYANTLGLVKGRVYYNLLNWYKMLAMLPGYTINAENMERMMGVKERFTLDDRFVMSKGRASLAMGTMFIKMVYAQLRLGAMRKSFHKQFQSVMSEYEKINFEALNDKEILEKHHWFETNVLKEWKAPLVNDFFAMIWFGLLEKQVRKYQPEEKNLHNDLLCGSQDIISVQPIYRSLEIADKIINDEACKALFSNHSADEVWSRLNEGAFPEVAGLLRKYIKDFGNRCVGELKLETISYVQEPAQFIAILQSYVKQGISSMNRDADQDIQIRRTAEEKMNAVLGKSPLKRWWFNTVLKMTRSMVSNRENLRYERTRAFGMIRTMFSALGNYWENRGYLEDKRDIFYIELEELKEMRKQGFDPTIRERIQERKVAFKAFESQLKPSPRFFTYGNDFSDQYIYSQDKIEAIGDQLKGTGCCPGIVEAEVQVVEDPRAIESLDGKILVTSSTDPGWVTLFPTAAAILVERGSLLSHSAIVSREMGIPCIVGVEGLLRSLKSGDKVWMNGSTGLIKKISHDEATK